MTRPRALTSTFKTVIALLTAILISVVGATALPAAALAGHGQAKGQQADRTDKPGKAHEQQQSKAHQQSKAPTASNGQSAGKTQQGGSSAKAQETQPTHGNSAQAHESKTSHGASTSKPASEPGDKGDPPGNNGTVKLAGFSDGNGPGHSSGDGSIPKHPSNDPHLPCTFSVEWFGFDAAGLISDVTFEQHAPTRGGNPHYDSVPLDGDSHSGGGSTAGYDGVETYNLDFEGDPHPKHGYHVKLTTETPYSQGSDRKHKVFWVEPCEETPGEETPEEETPEEETPGEETPEEETPEEETPGEETPGEETPGEETPGEETPGEETGGNTSTVVFGAQASVQESAQAATQSAAGGAAVPSAVEAGLTGDDEWSVLPLLAVLFGFGTTLMALARRRARVHAVKRD